MGERGSYTTGGINFGPLDPQAQRASRLHLPLAGEIHGGKREPPGPKDVSELERRVFELERSRDDDRRRVTELERLVSELLKKTA